MPHGGDWRAAGVPRLAAELAQPPTATYESFHAGELPSAQSFAEVEDGPIIPAVLKRAEDGPEHVVVRAFDAAGTGGRMVLQLPFIGRTVSVDVAPHEIKTLLVPTDPDRPVVEATILEEEPAETS